MTAHICPVLAQQRSRMPRCGIGTKKPIEPPPVLPVRLLFMCVLVLCELEATMYNEGSTTTAMAINRLVDPMLQHAHKHKHRLMES